MLCTSGSLAQEDRMCQTDHSPQSVPLPPWRCGESSLQTLTVGGLGPPAAAGRAWREKSAPLLQAATATVPQGSQAGESQPRLLAPRLGSTGQGPSPRTRGGQTPRGHQILEATSHQSPSREPGEDSSPPALTCRPACRPGSCRSL